MDPLSEQHVPDEPAATVAAPVASSPVRAFSFIETSQTLVTGICLALIFRAFFIEPFLIPTGSMADGLLGDHYAAVCAHCGWLFNAGANGAARPNPETNGATISLRCPNCQQYSELPTLSLACAGDRVLVQKWPLAITGGGLRPWDVIVFHDPANDSQNLIKRLIALPGENVELLDGDVYIDGRIRRKTAVAQRVLWSTVFDQDYVPVEAASGQMPTPWVSDEVEAQGQATAWNGLGGRLICYRGLDDVARRITFSPVHSRNYLQDDCGYNQFAPTNYVGDFRLSFDIAFLAGYGGLRLELDRGNAQFAAEVTCDGVLALYQELDDPVTPERVIGRTRMRQRAVGQRLHIEFSHVDYRVLLTINGREYLATSEGDYAPDIERLRTYERLQPARLDIVALNLSADMRHLRLERDVHYLGTGRRAGPGEPFALGPDEFFVLGDNSPNSNDSRDWLRVGALWQPALEAGRYRLGTVPRSEIVGRAFLVYLPGPQALGASSWRMLDLGRVRWVR